MGHRLRLLVFAVLGTAAMCGVGVPAPALASPADRAYEMVSPLFKGGFGALRIEAVSSSGEGVLFYSPGAFNGAPSGPILMDYISRRTPLGWSTNPVMPPASLIADVEATDVSPSLDEMLVIGKPGSDLENPLPLDEVFVRSTLLPDTTATWEPVYALEALNERQFTIQQRDADPSFCHVLLGSTEPLLTEARNTAGELYELNRGCDGQEKSLTLVGVNNKDRLISRTCATDAGIERYTRESVNTFNAISVDGSEVFFTDCLSGSTEPATPHQLFVRLGGGRTVEISKPFTSPEVCSEVPCGGASERGSAEFVGASEDGSRVFFMAPLTVVQPPLVPGDTDSSNNLYMAVVGCPGGNPLCLPTEREVTGLSEVSHDPNGGAAGVQGVLRVAPDGGQAYFVATGDLLSGSQRSALESEGRPVPRLGADNLYAYAANSGALAFIGDLCSGRELSGSVEDIHCPSQTGSDAQLWSSNESRSQTAGHDGRYLVLASYAQLTRDDTNVARDVYRYDAEAESLQRVSIGEEGYDANGNNGTLGSQIMFGNHGVGGEGAPVRSQYEMNSRAISEDGSRIVFMSAEPLSPVASNGLANAYEWREGLDGRPPSVSLISSGSGEEPIEDIVISPNGLSVLFDTVEGLVPQDTDGAPDVYDARLDLSGETFPQQPSQRRPCEGDACQGPLTNPAPMLVPGSVETTPGDNLPAPSKSKPAKKKKLKKKKPKAKKKVRSKGHRGKSSRRKARSLDSKGGKR